MNLTSKILVALAICSSAAYPESKVNAAEERFKAKFGRYTPAEEARRAEAEANTAYRDAAPTKKTGPANDWSEQRHQAKFGRPSPAEEAKINDEKKNTAYREVATPRPADRWHDNYFRTKYGRPAPKR
jgi:hypothetical protein